MNLKEKTLVKKKMFDGKLIHVRHDTVQLPNGEIGLREVVEHPGGVAIAAKDDNGKYFLVSQYRYAQQQVMLEFPAGKLERGEDPFECAKRELIEETGYAAKSFEFLGEFIPTGAYLEEKIYMYAAKDLQFFGQKLDSDEFINVSRLTLEEIVEKVMKQEIIDGKTMAMALKLYLKETQDRE